MSREKYNFKLKLRKTFIFIQQVLILGSGEPNAFGNVNLMSLINVQLILILINVNLNQCPVNVNLNQFPMQSSALNTFDTI